MPRILRRRPSAGTLIALVALFISLGGTSYAALRVTGADVVDRSLTWRDVARESIGGGEVTNLRGRDLQPSSLGGFQINEGDLGKVPSAATADSAGSVGGLQARKFAVVLPRGGAEQSIASVGGLSVLAACDTAGRPQVRAISAINDSELRSSIEVPTGSTTGSSDLDVGEAVDLDQGRANGAGVISYSGSNGAVATVNLGFDAAPTFGANPGCAVFGTAFGG
jgi:hypothetical protein